MTGGNPHCMFPVNQSLGKVLLTYLVMPYQGCSTKKGPPGRSGSFIRMCQPPTYQIIKMCKRGSGVGINYIKMYIIEKCKGVG